jgi:hypothetical protein
MNQDEGIRNMTAEQAVELERAGYAIFVEGTDRTARLPVIYAPRWSEGDDAPWAAISHADLRFSHLALVAFPTMFTKERAAIADVCRRCGAAECKPRLCQSCEDMYITEHLFTDPEFRSL